MGGLDFRKYIGALCAVLLTLLWVTSLAGCASYSAGRYHSLAKGENLYQLSRRYRVPVSDLVKANGIKDVSKIQVGEQIWIPRSGSRVASGSSSPKSNASTRRAAQRDARRSGDLAFSWPVEGARLSSAFGRRSGRPHEGIDLAIGKGTTIRASESGKVVHSGWLGDYGKVVIIKHAGYYRTVYAPRQSNLRIPRRLRRSRREDRAGGKYRALHRSPFALRNPQRRKADESGVVSSLNDLGRGWRYDSVIRLVSPSPQRTASTQKAGATRQRVSADRPRSSDG